MAVAAGTAAVAVPPAVSPPSAVYVPVLGAAKIPDGITEEHSMVQIVWWIGFHTNAQSTAIYDDGVDGWESIKMLTKEDVDAMAKSSASCTAGGGRIIFGTNRTKYLKAMVHWAQEFYRVSDPPTIVGLHENIFKHSSDL